MKTLFVSLVVALSLGGCRDVAAPFSPGHGAITVSIAPASVRTGGIATVAVSLVNRTLLPLRVGGSACPFSFVIQNSAGNTVSGSPEVFCVAVVVSVTIPPGDSITQRFSWVADGSGGAPLTPGTYSIRGSCD